MKKKNERRLVKINSFFLIGGYPHPALCFHPCFLHLLFIAVSSTFHRCFFYFRTLHRYFFHFASLYFLLSNFPSLFRDGWRSETWTRPSARSRSPRPRPPPTGCGRFPSLCQRKPRGVTSGPFVLGGFVPPHCFQLRGTSSRQARGPLALQQRGTVVSINRHYYSHPGPLFESSCSFRSTSGPRKPPFVLFFFSARQPPRVDYTV